MKHLYLLLPLLFFAWSNISLAQTKTAQLLRMQSLPKHYGVLRASTPIQIDGRPNEKSWEYAPWTESFIDIEGIDRPKPTHDTKVKMLWDEEHLYVYAQLEEPHIWGNLTTRDTIIYHNNDFEVFLKPFNTQPFYYEIEVNALNTVMDLLMYKPYRLGGDAMMHWDVKNLKTAVHTEGTLNNARDKDQYWAIEMAIPFSSLHTYSRPATPRPHDFWQINFSRVQWKHELFNGQYSRKKQNDKYLPEDNWVWSPIGIINMHFPERWGYIQFLDTRQTSTLPTHYKIQKTAWNISYLQQLYRQDNDQYAEDESQLKAIADILPAKSNTWGYRFFCDTERHFYQVEIQDKKQGLRATIDSFGNYSLHKMTITP